LVVGDVEKLLGPFAGQSVLAARPVRPLHLLPQLGLQVTFVRSDEHRDEILVVLVELKETFGEDIPAEREARVPESITPAGGYGFRDRACGAPRNDRGDVA
jgi:hypothetical protein